MEREGRIGDFFSKRCKGQVKLFCEGLEEVRSELYCLRNGAEPEALALNIIDFMVRGVTCPWRSYG